MTIPRKQSFLTPLLNEGGKVAQRFKLLPQDTAAIEAFQAKQDAIVLQEQKQNMSEKDFAMLTGGGMSAYSYTFTPGACGHTLMVSNIVTKVVLSLPYADRFTTEEGASHFEIEVDGQEVLDWLEEAGVKTGGMHHTSLAFCFVPCGLGCATRITTASGETKDFTDYPPLAHRLTKHFELLN